MKRQTRGNAHRPSVRAFANEAASSDRGRVEEDKIIQQALTILETRCCPGSADR